LQTEARKGKVRGMSALILLASALLATEAAEALQPAEAPADQGPVRMKFTENPGTWVAEDDYPLIAIETGMTGVTKFVLDIGTNGEVTKCTVTSSSGHELLDVTTCAILKARARFLPARDAKGNAIPDTFSSGFRWVLPDDPLPASRDTPL
jgi:protein TonB